MIVRGTLVPKRFFYVLRGGAMVVDWGDGKIQDVLTGEFVAMEASDVGHSILDRELDLLMSWGRVLRYDTRHVYLNVLPEGRTGAIDQAMTAHLPAAREIEVEKRGAW